MRRLEQYLYKLQISNYQAGAYRQIIKKPTVGTVNNTPRVRRLRLLTVALCVCGLGLPVIWLAQTVLFANWCLRPLEKTVQRHFIRQAKRRLKKMPHLIKIGITGSYGKTSVKNILAAMLAVKYRVVASPASFNTPMGFARTVNQNLRADTQILIMEMGARHPDDIREMCALLQPHHGIITSIGPCHLQTLGNMDTVARTKAALFAALPADGLAVTDANNQWCRQLTHPNLVLVSGDTQHYQTPLLGPHQQTNIALAAAMARHLGITDTAINQVAANLTPTPHRLQKIVAPNGIIILDDSYNANPISAASALAVLGTYSTRKVVQTPGFVEQGMATGTAHHDLCAQIKAVADAVIIVGATNRRIFENELGDFSQPVFYVANRDAAKQLYPQLLGSGDVLLLLNDLPEQY